MRRLLFALTLTLAISNAEAFSLDAQHVGCDCGTYEGHNTYILNWSGPWAQSLIYLAMGAAPEEEDFLFYAGYLPQSGTDSSPPHGYWFGMFVCSSEANCDMHAATLVPWEECDEVD